MAQPDIPDWQNDYINTALSGDKLGYVYTAMDKRLYIPQPDPEGFIRNAWANYQGGPSNFYVHVPWCKPKKPPSEVVRELKAHDTLTPRCALCGFCNLYTVPGKIPDGFANLVAQEIGLYYDVFAGKRLEPQTLYFGGGTPSELSINDVAVIYENLARLAGGLPNAIEKTMESSPDSLSGEYLRGLLEIGFNRISVGTQTFHPEVLRYIGRAYEPQLAADAIKQALELGFVVNSDLIAGLPLATEETFLNDVYLTASLNPHIVTIYEDMTRPLTRFGIQERLGILNHASPQQIYSWIEKADAVLQQHGYRRHTLTCWTRDKSTGYKQGDNIYSLQPLLGVGPGARSYGPDGHYCLPYTTSVEEIKKGISGWTEAIAAGQFPPIAGVVMTEELKHRAAASLGLMTETGVTLNEMGHMFNNVVEYLITQGLVEQLSLSNKEYRYRYTEKGKAISGALAPIFYSQEMNQQLSAYQAR